MPIGLLGEFMTKYRSTHLYKILWALPLLTMGVGPCKNGTGALQPQTVVVQPTPAPTPIATPTPVPHQYLYVASGACFAGGATTSTGSGIISKYSLETGERISTVRNYYQESPYDFPASIIDYSVTELLVAVENASGRRLQLVNKNTGAIRDYLVSGTIFSSPFRSISQTSDNGTLISKSVAVEKLSPSKIRISPVGTNPYISAPANNGSVLCANTNTAITFAYELPQGKILYGHAGATPNNKLVMISGSGYAATTDCLAYKTAPTTLALPTASVYHRPSSSILVAYGSATYSSNSLYSYTFNETTPSMGTGSQIFGPSVVTGPSAITVDQTTGDVYLANATTNSESIEKFTYDSTSGAFTKAGNSSFILKSEDTKCVSGLAIGY